MQEEHHMKSSNFWIMSGDRRGRTGGDGPEGTRTGGDGGKLSNLLQLEIR